jgi:hypothetical protein
VKYKRFHRKTELKQKQFYSLAKLEKGVRGSAENEVRAGVYKHLSCRSNILLTSCFLV